MPKSVPADELFVVEVLPNAELFCPVPAPNSVPAALCVDAPKVEPDKKGGLSLDRTLCQDRLVIRPVEPNPDAGWLVLEPKLNAMWRGEGFKDDFQRKFASHLWKEEADPKFHRPRVEEE